MSAPAGATALQLRSLVKPSGELEVFLDRMPVPVPGDEEILVRIQGTPLNPSDIGLLFGAADMTTAEASGGPERPAITAKISDGAMRSMAGRAGQAMSVGNEGAGLVVGAGSSPAAQALLGKTVAILGGGMYAQYRVVRADQCLQLPPGTTAAQGASAFVNPLTALGMIETMRREGHTALVHTAAASNLGQMLQRLCAKDGVALVNIVRKPEQVELLKSQGAGHVCDTSSPGFTIELAEAVAATGATIAFDATGGGRLATQILTAMEWALTKTSTTYSRYGSSTHKQVYLYGRLDTRTTELDGTFGMAWGVGGWLLFNFLQKIGSEAVVALKQRIASEITTTFASHYTREISLEEMLHPVVIESYYRRSTGAKFLLNPSLGVEPIEGL